MLDQTVVNIIVAIAATLGGFLLKQLWDAVKDLQISDKEMAKEVSEIKVLVAGSYVTREEFKYTMDMLVAKLDKISDFQRSMSEKIDMKADRRSSHEAN